MLGGRLADLLGRKVTFLAGLAGFAGVSAIGGASVNFAMLITARACQGAFAALLVPSALSLLTTTFTSQTDRGKAFGIYGAIAEAGGAIGLLLGGALTEYLSWRWTLYVNLLFAGVAFTGGALLLARQPSPAKPRLDIPGVLLVSGGVFCLVYGFSNAATHRWATPSTWGFLAAGAALLVVFAAWQARAAHPLLPPRVVLDRNRGGACLSFLIAAAGLFGIFLFLTYYLQQTLGYSPLVTGVAFLPISGGLVLASNLATIVLMPRTGPKPLVASGMLAAAGGAAWLAQLGLHAGYATGVLGPIILAAVGLGLVIAPVINTGTFGVAPQDAGVASATVTVGRHALPAAEAARGGRPDHPPPAARRRALRADRAHPGRASDARPGRGRAGPPDLRDGTRRAGQPGPAPHAQGPHRRSNPRHCEHPDHSPPGS